MNYYFTKTIYFILAGAGGLSVSTNLGEKNPFKEIQKFKLNSFMLNQNKVLFSLTLKTLENFRPGITGLLVQGFYQSEFLNQA